MDKPAGDGQGKIQGMSQDRNHNGKQNADSRKSFFDLPRHGIKGAGQGCAGQTQGEKPQITEGIAEHIGNPR